MYLYTSLPNDNHVMHNFWMLYLRTLKIDIQCSVERFHKKKDEKSDLWTKGADGKKAEATEMTPKDPSDTGTTVLANEMAT